MATKEKKVTLKPDRGFIVRVREQLMNLEVSNENYNLQSTGIRNLAEFCRIVDLDYNLVNRAIGQARDNEETTCNINDWHFSWMTIDEFRSYLEVKGVPLHVRMNWIRGRIPTNAKDFPAVDRAFGKLLLEFMS
jgi:hypothetical protein